MHKAAHTGDPSSRLRPVDHHDHLQDGAPYHTCNQTTDRAAITGVPPTGAGLD